MAIYGFLYVREVIEYWLDGVWHSFLREINCGPLLLKSFSK